MQECLLLNDHGPALHLVICDQQARDKLHFNESCRPQARKYYAACLQGYKNKRVRTIRDLDTTMHQKLSNSDTTSYA